MTVISPRPPPPALVRCTLIADDLALDFANTESGRGFPSHREPFPRGRGMSSNGCGTRRRCRWRRPTGCGRQRERSARIWPPTSLAQAIALREAIHAIGVGARASRQAARGARSPVCPHLHARMCRQGGARARRRVLSLARGTSRASPVEAALGPVALAAVRLFTEGDFQRIRECGGHACGWLFYDRSKNNRRRWCEMEVCGNRAKQRRLAARRREA